MSIRPTTTTRAPALSNIDAPSEDVVLKWPSEDRHTSPIRPLKEDEQGKKIGVSIDMSLFTQVDIASVKKRNVRGFYEKQNALIEIYEMHIAKSTSGYQVLNTSPEAVGLTSDVEASGTLSPVSGSAETDSRQPQEHQDQGPEGGGGMVQSAILLSFGCNLFLLVVKGWMAMMTGSMSMIASTADSLLDLLSGIVLLLAEQAAHGNVNHYEYPEGRGRIEPIGIIIFATVMCLSSLNILYESLKIVVNGYLGKPPVLEVGWSGFAVLSLTIVLKLALWGFCSFVLKTMEEKSGSVEAYAQDHLNDVMTNTVAVACVFIAVRVGGSGGAGGWWVADPLGAAVISLWIMYSWWDVGKEHVENLSGRSASTEFLQQLTFIAANCDEKILQVDTVRAFYFGDRFLVEIHVVLDEHTPLRTAHDVGEKLENMIEKLQEVERCFVHMDYETDHEPEYRRRLRGPGSPSSNAEGGGKDTEKSSPQSASPSPSPSP